MGRRYRRKVWADRRPRARVQQTQTVGSRCSEFVMEVLLILAVVAVGAGGSADDHSDVGTSASSARKAQGYGGERDADTSIGA